MKKRSSFFPSLPCFPFAVELNWSFVACNFALEWSWQWTLPPTWLLTTLLTADLFDWCLCTVLWSYAVLLAQHALGGGGGSGPVHKRRAALYCFWHAVLAVLLLSPKIQNNGGLVSAACVGEAAIHLARPMGWLSCIKRIKRVLAPPPQGNGTALRGCIGSGSLAWWLLSLYNELPCVLNFLDQVCKDFQIIFDKIWALLN